MADRIKGITVEIGGETIGLQKALKDVNKQSRSLQRELNDVQKLLKFDPDNVELIAQKQKLLTDQVENTTQKLKQLKEAEAQVQDQFEKGEIGAEQYRAFQREIIATDKRLRNLKEQIGKVDDKEEVGKLTKKFRTLKDAANDAKDQIEQVGQATSGIGLGAAAGVGALVTEFQDYNEVLARLVTNASLANQDVGLVEEAFRKIVGITGEADAAGETLANLLQSGFQGEELLKMIDLVNGGYIRFSDTLKTEGIADGIQETFATGKAVGAFGELLERSGINLEDFDKKMGAAKTTSEKTNLIMQTMSDLGLTKVTEKYAELNPEVQANAEANAALQDSLAELAVAFTPLVIKVTEFITKVVDWMKENPELTKTILIVVSALGALLGIFFLLAPIITGLVALAGALGVGVGAIAAPVLIVIGIIAGLIAIGILLWKNWDKITEKAKEVGTVIKNIWGKTKQFLEQIDLKAIGANIIDGLIKGIKSMASKAYESAKEVANSIGSAIKKALKIKSPSELTMDLGLLTGEGLAIGLDRSISQIKSMSAKLAKAAAPKIEVPKIESSQASAASGSKNMTVNFYSPKALDVREAKREFNRSMNKLSAMW